MVRSPKSNKELTGFEQDKGSGSAEADAEDADPDSEE